MKTCRTLTGLLKAIEKGENVCLKYTDKVSNCADGRTIIYLQSGTNLIVSDKTYCQIEKYLVRV